MDSDLGFLLIFIILPTALIVSGIWFLVLIRKDARIRDLSQASTQPGIVSGDVANTSEPPEFGPAEPVVIATLPAAVPAGPEAGVTPLDEEAEDSEEFWTTPSDTQSLPDPATASESASIESNSKPQTVSGYTEEIVPVAPQMMDESASTTDEARDPVSTESVGSEDAQPQSEQAGSPEDSEVDPDEDVGTEHPERKRRQPDARLVPSSENVKKRTSTGARRAPPIPRSTSRDEDSMESPDSGRDV